MTVIAYREGVLAADTATNFGCGMIRKDVPKIISHEGKLAAAAGDAVYCKAFLDWVIAGQKIWDLPKPAEDDGESEAMVVNPDRTITIYAGAGSFICKPTYFAIGSGAKFALGAMHHGATAQDAVRAAMEHDPFSGGEINTFRLGA